MRRAPGQRLAAERAAAVRFVPGLFPLVSPGPTKHRAQARPARRPIARPVRCAVRLPRQRPSNDDDGDHHKGPTTVAATKVKCCVKLCFEWAPVGSYFASPPLEATAATMNGLISHVFTRGLSGHRQRAQARLDGELA